MKVVILAGGLGTRLSEETISKPKPMTEIGQKPILSEEENVIEFAELILFDIYGKKNIESQKPWFRQRRDLRWILDINDDNTSPMAVLLGEVHCFRLGLLKDSTDLLTRTSIFDCFVKCIHRKGYVQK